MKYLTYMTDLDDGGIMTYDKDTIRRILYSASTTVRGVPYFDSPEYTMHRYEYDYIHNGRKIIFLENQTTVNELLALKFKANTAAHIPMPWRTFSLSPPAGAKVDGQPLVPCLVYCGKAQDHDELSKNYCDYLDVKTQHIRFRNQAFGALKLVILAVGEGQKTDTPSNRVDITINPSQIVDLLNMSAFDYTKYTRIMNRYNPQRDELTLYECRQQFWQLKLVLALVTYNHITDNKHLRKGVPFGFANKLHKLGLPKQTARQASKHHFKISPSKQTAQHVRSGFWRQLSDEKYYQKDEWKGKPRGSRWTKVSPTLVGRTKGDPYTENLNDS